MATELLMPKLGMTMEEGTIVSWFKEVGDHITEGEILLEILTDKVNMEVEAPATGQVLAILAAAGDIIEVNKPIAYIGQPGEKVESHAVAAPKTKEQQTLQVVSETAATVEEINGKVKASPAAKRIGREEKIELRMVPPSGPGGRIIAMDVKNYKVSPLALKIAQDKGVELAQVAGTGIGGKIMKEDVQHAAIKVDLKTKGNCKPLSGMRKTIADHMSNAWVAPHVTHNMEVDMSGIVELRNKIIPGIEKRTGTKPSYNDLIIKVTAKALREYQQVINARLHPEGLEICDEVNVGMAVALPNGLVVPVIKNADTLSVEQITKRTKELAVQAKTGKLLPDEMSGGTFTVTNLGMYGIDTFSPIVNAPEVCILGVGQLQDKPVVKDGEVVIQPRMSLSLSFDHRAVDGAQAAEFLRRIKELLEDYLQLI
jgi:pyruvate dehydrogenase E2 component (dihydrolipoamide acetyltransferase)